MEIASISDLTESQLRALMLTERINSAISIAAIFFVCITYVFAPGFDKPINRLIYFASFGNLGSNVAAIISEYGPMAGSSAPICKFQAFLIQMFLGVDCYWALCMAVNVYLVFFRGYTVQKLRSLDLSYLLICYGLAFIPAFMFIFIDTRSRGPIYGPAIIWCWITVEWDFMRLVFLYMIVWIAMILALVIYGRAAKAIWDRRDHLDGFLNPLNEHPFVNTTTEIIVTSETRPADCEVSKDALPLEDFSTPNIHQPYSVNVHAPQRPGDKLLLPLYSAKRVREVTREIAVNEQNAGAWLYARVAFLFFLALLITWVPSSINRVYACIHPSSTNFGLNYAASFVFPLQGFWNAIVYVITSQSATARLLTNIRRAMQGKGKWVSSSSSSSPSSSSTYHIGNAHHHHHHHFDEMGKPRRLRSNEGIPSCSASVVEYSTSKAGFL